MLEQVPTERAIRDFLIQRGVQLLWTYSAMNHIMLALKTSKYHPVYVIEQDAKVTNTRRVERYTATVRVSQYGRAKDVTITYTFQPFTYNPHKVTVTEV